MNRLLLVLTAAALAVSVSGCKASTGDKPAGEPAARVEAVPAPAAAEAAPAAEAPKAPEGAPAAEPAAEPAQAAKEADEAPDDPDDDSTWGDGKAAGADRDKLAKAYQEVYCAQKKGEMDKLLDIYKANGFEKPEDFISTWVEVARDTTWVTKVATDAAARCK